MKIQAVEEHIKDPHSKAVIYAAIAQDPLLLPDNCIIDKRIKGDPKCAAVTWCAQYKYHDAVSWLLNAQKASPALAAYGYARSQQWSKLFEMIKNCRKYYRTITMLEAGLVATQEIIKEPGNNKWLCPRAAFESTRLYETLKTYCRNFTLMSYPMHYYQQNQICSTHSSINRRAAWIAASGDIINLQQQLITPPNLPIHHTIIHEILRGFVLGGHRALVKLLQEGKIIQNLSSFLQHLQGQNRNWDIQILDILINGNPNIFHQYSIHYLWAKELLEKLSNSSDTHSSAACTALLSELIQNLTLMPKLNQTALLAVFPETMLSKQIRSLSRILSIPTLCIPLMETGCPYALAWAIMKPSMVRIILCLSRTARNSSGKHALNKALDNFWTNIILFLLPKGTQPSMLINACYLSIKQLLSTHLKITHRKTILKIQQEKTHGVQEKSKFNWPTRIQDAITKANDAQSLYAVLSKCQNELFQIKATNDNDLRSLANHRPSRCSIGIPIICHYLIVTALIITLNSSTRSLILSKKEAHPWLNTSLTIILAILLNYAISYTLAYPLKKLLIKPMQKKDAINAQKREVLAHKQWALGQFLKIIKRGQGRLSNGLNFKQPISSLHPPR